MKPKKSPPVTHDPSGLPEGPASTSSPSAPYQGPDVPPVKVGKITKTPGVCGGSACIDETRIPVYVLEGLYRQGANMDTFRQAYPQLSQDQINAAMSYAILNKEEMDMELSEESPTLSEADALALDAGGLTEEQARAAGMPESVIQIHKELIEATKPLRTPP